MHPDLALLSTLIGSNYPRLELVFMVPNVFEPLKFNCIVKRYVFLFLSEIICCNFLVEKSRQYCSDEGSLHMYLWRNMENYPNIIQFTLFVAGEVVPYTEVKYLAVYIIFMIQT